MRVCAVPADLDGCGSVRVLFPAAAAVANGTQVTVLPPIPPARKAFSGEVPVSIDAGNAEVVLLHRPAHTALVDAIPVLQAEGRAVVVDLDDNLAEPHPEHQWARLPGVSGLELARACEMADLVTVSTPRLATIYGAHGRVVVLRNAIPAVMLEMPRDSDQRTLGWGGTVVTHPGDLPVTGGAVPEALETADWRFKVIGGAERVRLELGLDEEPTSTGGLSVQGYQQALGTLDVGIVPLADTAFNGCKSWLKGLEYAARGVPFVAAPTPEYQDLAALGAGVLAATPREWYARLRDLMRDETLRSEQAQEGLAVAGTQTFEARAGEWCTAWGQAIVNRGERS